MNTHTYETDTVTEPTSLDSKSIHLEARFDASPEYIYELLTNGTLFGEATGKSAKIGAGEGAAFSIFDGFINGRQVELVPGKRIVQAWRFSVWEPGVYSLARLALEAADGGTRLVLDHENIAEGVSPFYPSWKEHVAANWPVYYFKPFVSYLAKNA